MNLLSKQTLFRGSLCISVPLVFLCRLLSCPAVGRGTGRPRGSATATNTRKPFLMLGRRSLTLGRRLQMIRYTLCMTCRPLTCGIAISPTKKSSKRFAQGMIHEMALRVPLLHTTHKKAWTVSGPCRRMQPFHRRACPLHRNHPGRRTQSGLRSTHDPWVFRRHVPGPPDEPLTQKPYVPEIIHHIQYGPPLHSVTATPIR